MRRGADGPAFVMPVRRWRSELERSPGVSPKYDCTPCAELNRDASSMAARNRAAVTGPTPGTVITSGARYRYFAVPAQLFHEFLSADSKGVFFNRRIRPCYPCTELDA
jgi:hypothetical protein